MKATKKIAKGNKSRENGKAACHGKIVRKQKKMNLGLHIFNYKDHGKIEKDATNMTVVIVAKESK